jgi:hypothetical protein
LHAKLLKKVLATVAGWGTIGDEMRTRKAAKQANISITRVPVEIIDMLRKSAKTNNRSLAGEIRAILAAWTDRTEGRAA